MDKKYWHELSQKEIDKLIEDMITQQFINDNYKQPDWCGYPDALNLKMGCWTLTDLRGKSNRLNISKEFCQTCFEFKKEKT